MKKYIWLLFCISFMVACQKDELEEFVPNSEVTTKVNVDNDNVTYSCKTFLPINEILYDGTARPYTWTTNELIQNGYLD